MGTTTQDISLETVRRAPAFGARPSPPRSQRQWPVAHMAVIAGLWLIVFFASLSTPALLDDADATHAQAAEAMLTTGDWVTLHVNGVRYLEKAPLPYWIAAWSLRIFDTQSPNDGNHAAFAIHLPLALTVLALALLGHKWSREAFGQRTALYTTVFVLSACGTFLFTRIFIPDALLSLWLALTLYCFLRALEPAVDRWWSFAMWASLALAVLTKGLVAVLFFVATAGLFLLLTGEFSQLRKLRPITGTLLFLGIAAPWHILAGLQNTRGAGGHGFFWFYFINEHVLRFLGRRIPQDFNKLPATLYWLLHLIWLFPWSFFAPAAVLFAWRKRREIRLKATTSIAVPRLLGLASSFTGRTILLLAIFSGFVLIFFSLSTNQEYYTFPVYLPLLMLIAAAVVALERSAASSNTYHRAMNVTYGALSIAGLVVAATLCYGLWTSRHQPFVADIGAVLAHRGVGNYTLSMSHIFDLTGPSFAALRLPAALAAMALSVGPVAAWILNTRRRPFAAIMSLAATSAVFLIASHIALVRFAPMLSSRDFASDIQSLERNGQVPADTQIMIFGDQAFGSSIPFYLGQRAELVDGRSTSMLFGSTFPDAPPIFVTHDQLLASWGNGSRKILFVPFEQRETVDRLLGPRQILLAETSGKALITDRPIPAR